MNHPLYLQLVTDSLYTLLPESDPDIDVYVDGRRVTTDGTENENAVIPLGAFPVNQTLKVQLKVHDFTMVEKKKAHKKITHLPKYNVNVGYGEVFKAVQKKDGHSAGSHAPADDDPLGWFRHGCCRASIADHDPAL